MITSPKCVVCDSTTIFEKFKIPFSFKYDGQEVAVMKCKECHTEFCYPRPTSAQINEFYRTNSAENEIRIEYYKKELTLLNFGGFHEAQFMLRKIEQFISPPASLFDVGCGNGWHLATAKALGYQVSGIDASQSAIAVCKSVMGMSEQEAKVNLFENIEVEELGAEQFDVVVVSQTLEHVISPTTWIKKAVAILRKGGLLVIAVPNHASLEAKLLGSNYGLYCLPEHLNYFVPESFQSIDNNFDLSLDFLCTRSHYALNLLGKNSFLRGIRFIFNIGLNALMPGKSGRFIYAFLRKP